jgi:hypothetical protein
VASGTNRNASTKREETCRPASQRELPLMDLISRRIDFVHVSDVSLCLGQVGS